MKRAFLFKKLSTKENFHLKTATFDAISFKFKKFSINRILKEILRKIVYLMVYYYYFRDVMFI